LTVLEIFAVKVGSCVKSTKNFTGGKKFLGEGPKFLDLHYKFDADTDHVVKFHSDQQRELGDLVAN